MGYDMLRFSGVPARRIMPILSHGISDPGCVRPENQDRILVDDAAGLYVVCDGVGGRRRGGVAAEIAVNAIRQCIESSGDPSDVTWPFGYNTRISFAANRLFTAVRLANRQVWRRSEESLEFLGMGTTVTAVLIERARVAIANIGDTRVYLFRGESLEQLSLDHTASTQVPSGSGMVVRTVLTSAAGSQENVEVHMAERELRDADLLLLCSDGLYNAVPEARIAAVLSGSQVVREQAEALVRAARTAGAPDNISAVVLRYGAE